MANASVVRDVRKRGGKNVNYYLVLTIAIILGYFFKGYGGKHKKKVMELLGWFLMIGCSIAMLVMKYGYKL